MMQTMQLAANISKNVSNPVGVRIKELTYLLCYAVRVFYDVPDRDAHIEKRWSYALKLSLHCRS